MKTAHRETIKSVCRILSTIYFDNEFDDEEVRLLSKARNLLTEIVNATGEEYTQMMGHNLSEKTDSDE